MTWKSLDHPDAVRPLGRGTGAFVDLAGMAVGRAVLEPGWRWSVDVKPLVGTASCEVHHLQLVVSGRLGVRMDDGEEHEFAPNDVGDIPAGHDAWVVGDEPLVLMDVSGNIADFALPASPARTVVTMLMTDIVDSTRTASQLGDAAWKQRLADHNRIVRRQLERFSGREIETTGDGFLAVFGSAEAALRAAMASRDAVRAAGLEIRAGVHTGEVETARCRHSRDPGTRRGANHVRGPERISPHLCRHTCTGCCEPHPFRVGWRAHAEGIRPASRVVRGREHAEDRGRRSQ